MNREEALERKHVDFDLRARIGLEGGEILLGEHDAGFALDFDRIVP